MNIPLQLLKPLVKRLSAVKSEVIILDTAHGVLAAQEQNLAAWIQDDGLKDEEKVVYFFSTKKFAPLVTHLSGILTVRKTDKSYSLLCNKTRIDLEEAKVPWKYEPEVAANIAINTAVLQELIKFVQIAPDPKQTGMTFSGMVSLRGYDDPLDPYVEAIATDTKRIASIALPCSVEKPWEALLPCSLLPLISSLTNEKCLLLDSEPAIIIKCGSFTARANKFTNKFPDAKKFFPLTYDFTATVDAKSFLEALERIEPVSTEGNRATKLTWANNLELRTGDKTVHGKDEVEYQLFKGRGYEKAFEMVLDGKYLSDFFSRVSGPVTCSFAQGKKYAVFQSGEKKYLVARFE